ncbi:MULTISPECIES: GGDEF domain-containing protein [unclassified Sphingomonas]|uniref:GGDEF domain-containing protein n=1 Tax=unclassified Sphingomonas TaxID=196159 RepID=UPI0006F7C46A|nr:MULTISPECIES: GGDEF domain-containing protein [unclassified Sphingomonas]KQM24774.1 hypothetical protein ASE58_15355 [Sphingomonas sp. Leaf9]KQM42432.1 hypothetical protein ASE57_15360 [Sphingomonas sp. Leaf11]
MFRVPDQATLSLCAVFVSLCFAAMFLGLWRRNPAERFWLWWSASRFIYVVGVVGFNELPPPIPAPAGMLLFGASAAATLLTLAGLRSFAGMRPWRGWMTLLLLVPSLLYGAVAIHSPGLMTPAGASMTRMAGGIGLTIVLTTCGVVLLAGARGWARMIGVALIAHLPSYATVLTSAWIQSAGLDAVATWLWITQPVLMLAMDLLLLAMPGMMAMERLRQAASCDGLTGLYNRHWLATVEPARAAAGVAVAMIDLDGFKGVNDRCGHAAGDRLLADFARHLRDWTDRHDADAVRLGGDEFLILFAAGDDRLAASLQRHVAAAPDENPAWPRWSASIGIAPCPAGSTTLQGAMHAADETLYSVKKARRSGAACAA